MTDIVSVPTGNFTPGARATLEFPAALINAAWNQANTKFDLFEYKMGQVTNTGGTGWLDDAAVPTISFNPVTITNPTSTNSISATSDFEAAPVATPALTTATITTPTDPGVTIPTSLTVESIIATFDTEQQVLWDQLVDGFVGFRTTYFPNESDVYAAAETWLQEALANVHGLPSAVAAQMLTDDTDRITVDLSRASDSLTARFAASRFPLPAGVLASGILQLQQSAQDKVAESSRKLIVASVEQLRFVVEKILSLRQIAMSAAVDYCKTLASATPATTQLTEAAYDAQVKLISAAAAYYGARTNASEAVAKTSQFNVGTAVQIADMATKNAQFNVAESVKIADIDNRNSQFNVGTAVQIADMTTKNAQFNAANSLAAAEKNQAADLTTREYRLKALLGELHSLAQMATALFNNLHVSSSTEYRVSGNADV
jgi:hypothetical protein